MLLTNLQQVYLLLFKIFVNIMMYNYHADDLHNLIKIRKIKLYDQLHLQNSKY